MILLAQGRFAEFLLARNDDRQRLLRKLFGTRTYEDYQNVLEQRRKEAERALAAAGDGVDLLLGEAERLVEIDELTGRRAPRAAEPRARRFRSRRDSSRGERAAQRAAYRSETLMRERDAADAAHRAAEAAHAAAKALREKQELRARSRAALAQLEERAAPIAADRRTLERALAAETLRASIETTAHAVSAAAAAAEAEADARAAWIAAGEHADAAALGIRIDELTGDLAVATAAADDERRLEDGEKSLAATRARITEFDTLLGRIDAARAGLPERIALLDAEIAAHTAASGALAAARTRSPRRKRVSMRRAMRSAWPRRSVTQSRLTPTHSCRSSEPRAPSRPCCGAD